MHVMLAAGKPCRVNTKTKRCLYETRK